MPEAVKVLLALIIFLLLPGLLLLAPFLWYGRRRGWGMREYAWPMVIIGVGWSAVFGLWVLKTPPIRVAVISGLLLLVAVLYAIGLVAWEGYFRRKRSAPEKK